MLLDNHLGPINHPLMKSMPAKRLQWEPAPSLREQKGRTCCRHVVVDRPHDQLRQVVVRLRLKTGALVAGLLALAFLPASAGELKKIGDSVVDPAALYFTKASWGNCVNGQTFQQDALASFREYQYAAYYDSARRLCVARRRAGESAWEVIRFADYHFKGNDTHNVAVLGICPADGTIHLAFDHHGHPLHYRVSRPGVAQRPGEYKWTAELFGPVTSQLEPGKDLLRVTYPRFLRTPAGGMQFGCRIGGSGNGDKCLADYDPVTRVWSGFGAYAAGQGRYGESTSRNAYLNGLDYDRRGRLHVTWCWRETGNPMTNHDLDYAWSDDAGRTWFNDAGDKIGERGKQPITIDSPGVRVVEIPTQRGLINATTQALDSHNRIHVVTFHLPDAAPGQANWEATRKQTHYFHYWREGPGKWRRNEMDFNGSRPQLWFDAADNAYLVFVGDRFNPSPYLSIAMATAGSRWQDWKVVHREPGPFTGQPRIDRYNEPGLLSVYIQEEPKEPKSTASALRVITFEARKQGGLDEG
jgi:uncharacterized protein (DUF2249 family)